MKQGDVLMLMDGIAPAIAALLGKTMAPIVARLEATEKALADVLAELAARPDVPALVTAEVAKALAEQPKPEPIDVAAIERGIDERCAALTKRLDDMPAPVTEADIAALAASQRELQEFVMMDVKTLSEKIEALPKSLTAEEVAALIPPPEPVKGITIDDVRPLVRETVAAEVAALPPAEPGKSVTAADVQPMVESLVAGAFATMPVPKNGKDADPEVTRALVLEEVEKALAVRPAVPTAEEVAALIPPPRPGENASAEAIAVEVEKVLATWKRPEGVTVEQLLPAIESAVDKAVAARPAPENGSDGRGIAGLLKDHEGFLVATFTDGATVRIARVDGDNGKDGLGFEDLDVVDGPTSVTWRFVRGDRVKEWTFPKASLADFFRFGWKDGEEYARGSVVMWGGQPWLAMADTKAKPETNSDWTMLAKKARDGRDGEAPKPPPVVKLK